MNDNADNDPRLYAIPDIHGHAKGEHKAFTDERPIPLSARMLFLWFYHACRRGWPRFLMVTDHMNYLTFEDPAAINLVRRALKLAQAGDLYGAAETASVEVGHAAVVSEGLRRGMHYSIGAEVDNDPRSRPDAQNIVDAMKPDGMIRSVHFLTIDHPTHGAGWNWPFDNPEFADVHEIVGAAKTWELYMATLLDAIERLPGNIVGHFYVPAIFGHWPDDATLDAYENQLVDACEARGMAIELNTRFLYRDHPAEEKAKYLAAYRRLLAKCKAKNVGVAVGSDAHSPKDQGRAFETILGLLDECEINELVFPIAGRLARVALRVERKPDPVAPAETAETLGESERKAVRKARTSEAPSRPKESSSKRDDAPAGGDAMEPPDEAVVKPKARPKRAKGRAAQADDARDEQAAADPLSGDDVPSSLAGTGSVTETPAGEQTPATAEAPTGTDTPAIAEIPAVGEVPSFAEASAVTDVPAVADEPAIADAPAVADEAALTDVPAGSDAVESSVTDVAAGSDADEPVVADVPESVVGSLNGSGTKLRESSRAREPERIATPERGATTSERNARVAAPVAASVKAKPTAAATKTKPPVAKAKAAPKKSTKPSKPAAKPAAKKTVAKRAPVAKKTAAKKTAAKKAPAKKAVVKKAPPRATAAKKTAVKKAGAKKSAVKKSGAKKTAPKRR